MTEPEPELPFDPAEPLRPRDEKIMAEFAHKYNEFRQADLETSPFFADVCHYVRDNRITKPQLSSILEENVEMPLLSAKVEATHILNINQEDNAEILQGLLDGKITVSDARMNSAKAIMAPAHLGQPDSAAPAALKEKRAKHKNPYFNQPPLSPEERAARHARVAAEDARRAAMTPEEREAAEAAARKKTGILTPEERKARQAERAAHEKARIEKLPAAYQARLAADFAKGKKLMAEERARLAAKKRSSE